MNTTRAAANGRGARAARRLPGSASLLMAALLAASCSETANETVKTPPSAPVGKGAAWNDAEMVAAREPGRSAAGGSGRSMEPLYGDNTVLVITPIPYDQLDYGMIVAYMNRQGRKVVHQLISREPDGWKVQGLNNEYLDNERVTPENLLGVIYASFSHSGSIRPESGLQK